MSFSPRSTFGPRLSLSGWARLDLIIDGQVSSSKRKGAPSSSSSTARTLSRARMFTFSLFGGFLPTQRDLDLIARSTEMFALLFPTAADLTTANTGWPSFTICQEIFLATPTVTMVCKMQAQAARADPDPVLDPITSMSRMFGRLR